jgi:plastocyanin
LSRVSPAAGPTTGGLAITLTGTGFAAGAAVSIGGVAASSVAVGSATSITATTPAHAAGAADIVVTNPDGQSGRLAGGFNYEVPVSAPPTVASVGPDSGPVAGGTNVMITGTGFTQGATVAFGTTPATSVNVASATSITATAPAGSAGRVDLVVTNSDGQSARLNSGYTYVSSAPPPPPPPPSPTPVAPTVASIAPASGTTAGGTAVTITGTGFAAGATVSFGGTSASGVSVASASSLTATTPAHAAGAVDVVVTNTDGLSGRLNGGFTYNAPAPPPVTVVVVTITNAGTSPSVVTIAPGTRIRFVNNHTSAHDVTSDPHPAHTACPQINAVGMLLPGQTRDTDVFTAVATCGYHDHNDPDDPRWTGTILIR